MSVPSGAAIDEGADDTLLSQIGIYPTTCKNPQNDRSDEEFATHLFEDGGLELLYGDIEVYGQTYTSNVRAYIQKNKIPTDPTTGYPTDPAIRDAITKGTFFRAQYVTLLEQINNSSENQYEGTDEYRKNNPEACCVSMKTLLGEDGVKLYLLALEEETNSKAFMHANLRAATTHYEGPRWDKRLVAHINGVSGSGKSFAAQAAVRVANQFMPKKTNSRLRGNDVVAVDGGIAREVSQMYQLTIQAARNKGRPGVSDLYKFSKILGKTKDRIEQAASSSPTLGMVIPVTNSDWLVNRKTRNAIKKLEELPNTVVMCCTTTHEDPQKYEAIVADMATARAFNTDFQNTTKTPKLEMNKRAGCESKAPNLKLFRIRQDSARYAHEDYMKNSKYAFGMMVINDQIFLKEDSPGSGNWGEVKQNGEGVVRASRRQFELWGQLDSKPPLKVYLDSSSKPEPLIKTSGEIDLAIAIQEILKNAKKSSNQHKQDCLQSIAVMLDGLNTRDLSEVLDMQVNVQQLMDFMKGENYFHKTFGSSQAEKSIMKAITALQKIKKEHGLAVIEQTTPNMSASFREEMQLGRNEHEAKNEERELNEINSSGKKPSFP